MPGKKIGLVYSYNENWIGGTYYIYNLIKALNELDNRDKPEIVIIGSDTVDYKRLAEETGYPFLSYMEIPTRLSWFKKTLNRLIQRFNDKYIIRNRLHVPYVVFPVFDEPVFQKLKKGIYWIPDFQDKTLPGFFNEAEKKLRDDFQRYVVNRKGYLVLSSNDAQQNLYKYFPEANVKQYVVPFAVSHPEYQSLDGTQVLKDHQLPGAFFMCPNQFWMHKNHMVILRAVKALKDKNCEIYVVFSGKEHDYRNPDYANELKRYVLENQLQDNVRFLGFIDRKQQLKIMSLSKGIIQPSKSEGWSTVIEDAKAMNIYVIASSINIHHEQLTVNASFFDADDFIGLAEKLWQLWQNAPLVSYIDYTDNVKQFGLSFMNLVNDIG